MRGIRFCYVAATLIAILGLAHRPPAQGTASANVATGSAAPVAFVYVASSPSEDPNASYVINAFTADASGRLTRVKGSPFTLNVGNMVVNGKYLFGLNRSIPYIPRFLIEPDGALHWIQSTKVQTGCGGGIGPLILDHTGSTLYLQTSDPTDCLSSVVQSLRVEKSSELTFLGGQQTGNFFSPITFIGNNEYAYAGECASVNGETLTAIVGFRRLSNGMLVLGPTGKVPEAKDRVKTYYCPSLAAADPKNHVAIALSLQVFDPYHTSVTAETRIATYSADNSGNLSTTSTYANMPLVAASAMHALQMSPSGKLLAVCAENGLQIFHFNGGAPATRYTGLLTKNPIESCYWDNASHLYAAGRENLYVFTITPDKVTQAPGSPYAIHKAGAVIVQPKTPRPPS
jgi:hypothetical protein